MLKTKPILWPRESSDGLRISVMSRHTLNDGVTPHPGIDSSSYDLWLKCLTPPLELVGGYYRGEVSWDEFEQEYLAHISQPRVENEIEYIAFMSLYCDTTFLCIEGSPERCHRRLLAEECRRHQPGLQLKIR